MFSPEYYGDPSMLDLSRPSASKIVRRFQRELSAKSDMPDELRPPYERIEE